MKSYRGFIQSFSRPNSVFVFGSNTEGRHGGGAAAAAVVRFGAVMGQSRGLQGQSYAIPTCTGAIEPLPVEEIGNDVRIFLGFVVRHPELTFFLTPIGTGISSIDSAKMAGLFIDGRDIPNLIFPEVFIEFIAVDGQNVEVVDPSTYQEDPNVPKPL